MRVRKRWIFIGFGIIVPILLAGCFLWRELIPSKPRIIQPYIPKEGEATTMDVSAYDSSTLQPVIVEVTVKDLETQREETKMTVKDSYIKFTVIVGKKYLITAKYGDSIKSKEVIIEPFFMCIIVTEDGVISEIVTYRAPIL